MLRSRRRLWTWTVTTVASALVLAALVVGVFRLSVLVAPSYKQEIEHWVAEVMNRPVDIGNMDLTWRALRPTLKFSDVALQGVSPATPALEVAELELGFSLADLVRGQVMPVAINVVGAVVEIVRDPAGTLRIRGISARPVGQTQRPIARQLASLVSVDMRDASVLWHDQYRGRPPLWLRGVEMDIDRVGPHLDVEVSGVSQLGNGLINAGFRIAQSTDGELLEIGGRAQVERLAPGPWIDAWLPKPLNLVGEPVDIDSRFRWTAGGGLDLEGQFETGQLRQFQGPGSLQQVAGRFEAELAASGQTVTLQDLRVRDRDSEWTAERVAVEHRQTGARHWLAVQASTLRLQSLLPWVPAESETAPWHRATGTVRDLLAELEWSTNDPMPAISLTAQLDDAGLLPGDEQPAVYGLSGSLSLTEARGAIELASEAVTVELPAILSEQARIDQLTGAVQWGRQGDRWTVEATGLSARGHGADINGAVALVFGPEPVQLDIDLAMASEDVTALKPLVPTFWHPKLRAWLDQAIVSGRVGSGRLRIAGAADAFPYREDNGIFRLELNLNPASLSIGQGWPSIDDAVAQLVIDGDRLTVDAVSGRMLGVALTPASVEIADLREPLLQVEGGANGPVDRMLSFLSASPLSTRVGFLDELLDPRGYGHLDLSLGIPLKNIHATEWSGSVTLTGVELTTRGLEDPFRDVQGTIGFSHAGLSSTGLKGVFRDAPVRVDLSTVGGPDAPVTRLALESPIRFDTPDDPWARLLPDAVRSGLDGHSLLHAEVLLDGAVPDVLTIRSDMVDVVSQLPAPLDKPDPATAMPLTLELPIHKRWPRDTRVVLGDRLTATVRSVPERWLDRAALSFGGSQEPAIPDRGMTVVGTAPAVDVLQWAQWLPKLAESDEGASGQPTTLPPMLLDLTAGRLRVGAMRLGRQSLRGTLDAQGAQFTLAGAAEGELRWDRSGRGRWYARLERLFMERLARVESDPAKQAPTHVPQHWPEIDVEIGHLQVADLNAGRLTLRAVPRPSGISLETARMQGGEIDLELGGYAARPDEMTRAGLTGILETARIDKVMFAAGFVPNVRAEAARIALNIGWPDSPEGLHLETATGALDISFRDGALAAVDPGAGRVLGLFSFYALPRRLLLDFRDMTETGLTFDGIDGHFRISGGRAQTEDFVVSAPSVSIDVEGEVGLSTRTYDQVITVYPDVSSGVTLAGALFGGPAMGAILMIAQELLDRPLNQATQLSYHLGGTWDDPVITRKGAETPTPAPDKGPRS